MMPRSYSLDLRERVVGAMAAGASARSAASQFGVSVASAVRWSQLQRRTGGVAPGKLGGHRKPVLLPEREWLLARIAAEPDLTLRALLAEHAPAYGWKTTADVEDADWFRMLATATVTGEA